jgi:inositol transport system substrate-binding protein
MYRRPMTIVPRLTMVALMLAMAAGFAARPAATSAAQDEPLQIAFSVPGLNFPFFVHMMNEAQAAADAMENVELIQLDGQNSASKQTQDLEAMIVQGVDGIVISPADVNALVPGIEAVAEAGIPLVTVDRNVRGVQTLAHVGADNVRGGELQAERVIELLPDGGSIFELRGQPGASPAIDRDTGLKTGLEQADNIEITFDQTANFARDEAVRVVEDGLTANEPPDVIVAANDDMALGAAEVVQNQGLDIPIIGFDALPEALQAIQAGTMDSTIEQSPGQQASTALEILVDNIRNDVTPEEHDIFLEPILITAENLGEAERAEEAGIKPSGTPAAGTPAALADGLTLTGLTSTLSRQDIADRVIVGRLNR